jgi:hypothetical protein
MQFCGVAGEIRSEELGKRLAFGSGDCPASKSGGTMATAVFGDAESGNKASLQIAPRLKVNRDSRRYQCVHLWSPS